jgi:hypothetical protein
VPEEANFLHASDLTRGIDLTTRDMTEAYHNRAGKFFRGFSPCGARLWPANLLELASILPPPRLLLNQEGNLKPGLPSCFRRGLGGGKTDLQDSLLLNPVPMTRTG